MGEQKKILVVDDSDENRLLFELMLSALYDISFAKNGKEGLELFCERGADLILSDYEMPVKDGFWLLERVQDLSPETPVIIVSSSFFLSEKELFRAGAKGLIRKPFSPQVLLHTISKYL